MTFPHRRALATYLLFLAVSTCYASNRPLKTITRNAFWGIPAAGFGWGLGEAVNRSCANYSLDIPSIVTPTRESQLWLVGAGILGALLVGEKLYCDKKTSFYTILPIEDATVKQRLSKAIGFGITATTTFTILATAGKQSPLDAALCTAFGLGMLTCLEPNEAKNS